MDNSERLMPAAIIHIITAGVDKSNERRALANPYLKSSKKSLESAISNNNLLYVRVVRYRQNSNATLGRLYANNHLIGATIELPWKKNKKDVSRIPAKTYTAFTRDGIDNIWRGWRLQLVNVSKRDHIQIHSARMGSTTVDYNDTKGCIVVGDRPAQGTIESLQGNGIVPMGKIRKLFENLIEPNIRVDVIDQFPAIRISIDCFANDGAWPDQANEDYTVIIRYRNVTPFSKLLIKWYANDKSVNPVFIEHIVTDDGHCSFVVPGSPYDIQDWVTVYVDNKLIFKEKIFQF